MSQEKQYPLVSIITVNYNGVRYLKTLYDSLKEITYPAVELIMVDNASSDDSVKFVQQYYREVKIIQKSANLMFARANNEGIKVASGEYICLLNNDVKVDPHFIEPIIEIFEKNPSVAACQPKVLDMNQPDKFEYAGASGGFIDKYGYPFMRGRLFFTLEHDNGQYDSTLEVFWSTGACFFSKKSILDRTGLLDDNFIMHMEEIDLCWRMHLHNLKIYCVPASQVWHQGGGTLPAADPRKLYWNYRNNIFLLVKNLCFINLIRILSIRLILDMVSFLREILVGRWKNGGAILKAYWWNISHCPLLARKRSEIQKQRLKTDKEIFKLIYSGCVVWEYFIRGRRKFTELKRINLLISDKFIGKEEKIGL